MRIRSVSVALLVAGALGIASPALAGPPLLCHPYDIGDARSLPWGGSWSDGSTNYNVQDVVSDTEGLLTSDTPVIVRMETLRRAALYASRDVDVARSLLRTFTERARKSESAGRPDALAFLDAAYLSEALYEITLLSDSTEFRDRAVAMRTLAHAGDGYALIQKSLALQPDNASFHFAAALISAMTNRQAYPRHVAKARAGVGRDTLLARNIQHVS
jgi:hypothetical protein